MTDIVRGDDLHTRMEYARALSVSDLLPAPYRGKPANVLVAVEYGRALGLEPMSAIQGINVIQGKPTASAQLISGLVRRAGHTLRVRLVTDDKGHPAAEATIIRSDDPEFEFRSVWTMQRAQAAGLTGKGGSWQAYPAAMLKARAITEVARDACADVLAGVAYTEEELEPSPGPQRVSTGHLVDRVTGEIHDQRQSPPATGDAQTGTDTTVPGGSDEPEVVDAELLDVDEATGEVTAP